MVRLIRLLRLLAAALELVMVAWSVYQVIALLLEWWRSPSPDNGYPNEWGVRTTPLTPAEFEGQRALERRLAELVGEPVGSAQPAAAASTPSAAGVLHRDGVGE